MAASTGHTSASCAGVRPLRPSGVATTKRPRMNQVLTDVGQDDAASCRPG